MTGALPPDVRVGIGDDAAVIRTRTAGSDWIVTTDLLAEHVHFTRTTTPFFDLGYKSAAANLSDLAAMGATPRFLLVAIALPSSITTAEVTTLYRGLNACCRPHGVCVIGGDTSASRSDLFITITAIGQVASGRAVLRRGARVGDALYVSGTIGDSLAGLRLLQATGRRASGISTTHADKLIKRHRRPTARVALGAALARARLATAMLDLSDGLSGDLPHLCRNSQVGATVDATQLPISRALKAYADTTHQSVVDLALQGGEDYELLFTVAPPNERAVAALAKQLRVPLTRIGRIVPRGQGLTLCNADGTSQRWTVTAYRHFEQQTSPTTSATTKRRSTSRIAPRT